MLKRLQTLTSTIKLSIIGIGAMGRGLLYQTHRTPNVECLAIADIDINRCVDAATWLGIPFRTVSNVAEMEDAIRQGFLAIAADGDLVAQASSVQAVIEASNAIGPAARFALTALENRKHLVLMNAEIDSIFGPYLMEVAQRNGVTMASCDGDQHGVIRKIYDEMVLWGFRPIMAGNIKGYLDRYANPTMIIPEADKRNLDYKMCTAYTDGTKLNIEMSLLANALDMETVQPGMIGPRAVHANDALELFDLEALLERDKPVVDYVLGAQPGGGVFTIGYNRDPYQMDMMKYYKMGDGPFYVFYRPYHLCHVEAMEYVARAVLDNQSLLEPTYGFRTNVYAYAKRDLASGEELDGIGGYNVYGLIENCPPIEQDMGLPICLAEHVKLIRPIKKDAPITLNDIAYNPSSLEFDLYFRSQKRGAVAA